MKHPYLDIQSRIAEPPTWWDQNGVPRYGTFTPGAVAGHALEIILLRIACQSCERPFDVCMTWSARDRHHCIPSLADRIPLGHVEYLDPPNVECCPVGPTSCSVAHRVLEFWRQAPFVPGGPQWERVPELEIDVVPGWAKEDA